MRMKILQKTLSLNFHSLLQVFLCAHSSTFLARGSQVTIRAAHCIYAKDEVNKKVASYNINMQKIQVALHRYSSIQ